MATNKIKGLTVEIGGDTTKLGKALEDVNKKSRDLSGELGQINKLLKMDPGNADLLAQKQKVLAEAVETTSEKLKRLKEAEKQVQAQFKRGEVSEEQVRELQREIVATTKKLEGYEKAAKETADEIKNLGKKSKDLEKGSDKAADALDDMAKSADKAGDASDGLGSKIGGLVKGGLTALVTGVTAVIGAMAGSAEATREYRREMGKLDTAFITNSHSSETATKTYKTLQGILGETDQAVEAANHLAKLTDNEKDLAKWTDVATGVYATFGASLPVENLAEASNETAKTGKLTGGLADALNWAGVNEEDFQAKLDACSNEQERQSLILETLNGLYSEAADKYRETNAEVIRANEANEEWMSSMADVGGAIEPVLTDVKLLGASLLSDLVPGVQQVAEAVRGMMNGDEGAADSLGTALSGIFEDILGKVTSVLPQAAEVATSLITTLTTSLLGMLPELVNTAMEMAKQVISSLGQIAPMVIDALAPMIPVIVDTLVIGVLDNIPLLLDAAIALLFAIVDAIPVICIELGKAVPDILEAILSVLRKLPELLWTILETVLKKVGIWDNEMAKDAKAAATKFINGAIDTIKELPGEIWTWLQNTIAKVTKFGTDAASKAKTAAKNIYDAVVNGIKGLPSKMASIGTDLVKGLWNGIKDMTGWITDKLSSFGDSVLGGIKSFFGIESPSKVFRDEVGKMLPAGMAQGIEASADKPLKAMADLSRHLLDEADAPNGITLERQMRHTFAAPESLSSAQTGMLDKLDKILTAIERGQILTLDGKALVGATAAMTDSALGQRRALAARGAV